MEMTSNIVSYTDKETIEYKTMNLLKHSEDKTSGYLELIIGPMYAGKSTELIRIINRYKCLNKKIIVINHILNNRYGSSCLTTHNKDKVESCIILEKLNDLNIELLNSIDVIIIEELQFFSDAYDIIIDWCDNKNKTIVCAGLDGDFLRNPFGDVLKLIPHADKISKLSALCKKCGIGTLAHFTKRTTNNSETTLVGSDDIYEAVCRKHYLN
jgi:thymidine kinase